MNFLDNMQRCILPVILRGFKLTIGLMVIPFAVLTGAQNATSPLANAHYSQSPTFPHIRLFSTQYGNGSIPVALRPQVAQWLTSHFDYLDGGHTNLAPYDYNNVWALYQDGAGAFAPEVYSWVHDVAAQNGFLSYEDMLLHMNRDYAVTAAYAWSGLDQFDYFEQILWNTSGQGSTTLAVNGAFLQVGNTYTDVTTKIYDGQHKVTVSNNLLLGYAEPFDLVNITVSTGRVGGAAKWQYWNGSAWAALAITSDTTGGMASTRPVRFTPPAHWVPTSVNGSRSKYWVLVSVTNVTAAPVLSRVNGDNWASHYGSNNCRGWSKTDPHRVNVGLGNLEYNPTPPATATARFRYQARTTGNAAHNYSFANPSNRQNGQFTWIATILSTWANNESSSGFINNAMYIDEVGILPQTTPAFTPTMTNDLPPATTWMQNEMAFYAPFIAQAHAQYGAGFQVGANVINNANALALLFDFSTAELYYVSTRAGNISFSGMDAVLTANNPSNSKISFAAWDNSHFGMNGPRDGVPHLWDTANRTPIEVLATYYMGANNNSILNYNTLGWSYYDTDEYYYWAPTTTTLTAQLNADPSASTKTISLANAGAFTVPGGPIWTSSYTLKIGNDVVQAYKDSNTSFHTATPVLSTYPVGTTVQFAVMGHQSTDPIPDWHNVWYWANYFPAMSVDIGVPDLNGWKGGARDLAYILPPASSGYPAGCVNPLMCGEIWRRDFTNAIILEKALHDYTYGFEMDTYSPYIQLGGTYYPLNADGTTGNGITQVQLRAGEAAILMKSANPNRR